MEEWNEWELLNTCRHHYRLCCDCECVTNLYYGCGEICELKAHRILSQEGQYKHKVPYRTLPMVKPPLGSFSPNLT